MYGLKPVPFTEACTLQTDYFPGWVDLSGGEGSKGLNKSKI
jgi:hypothetical protein